MRTAFEGLEGITITDFFDVVMEEQLTSTIKTNNGDVKFIIYLKNEMAKVDFSNGIFDSIIFVKYER